MDGTADIALAAKRIVWGTYLNAGQTCGAPDYLYVQEEVKDELLERMKHYIKRFYGEDAQCSENFPRIVNQKHFERLAGLLENGEVVCGGVFDRERLQIAPSILDGVTWSSPVMQEEIFGPILPVLTFRDLRQAVEEIKERPKPLAGYLFTGAGKTNVICCSISPLGRLRQRYSDASGQLPCPLGEWETVVWAVITGRIAFWPLATERAFSRKPDGWICPCGMHRIRICTTG